MSQLVLKDTALNLIFRIALRGAYMLIRSKVIKFHLEMIKFDPEMKQLLTSI